MRRRLLRKPFLIGGAVVIVVAGTGGTGTGGTFTLTHDEEVVGRTESAHAVPFSWQHGGAALVLGRDKGFPVCDDYAVPFPWNGTLHELIVEVPGPTRPDLHAELQEALHRD